MLLDYWCPDVAVISHVRRSCLVQVNHLRHTSTPAPPPFPPAVVAQLLVPALQAHRAVAAAEREKAKRTAQQLLALAHQTSKVTESYEVCRRSHHHKHDLPVQRHRPQGTLVRHVIVCPVHIRLSLTCRPLLHTYSHTS